MGYLGKQKQLYADGYKQLHVDDVGTDLGYLNIAMDTRTCENGCRKDIEWFDHAHLHTDVAEKLFCS